MLHARWFPVHGSRFTVPGSRFNGSRFNGSRFGGPRFSGAKQRHAVTCELTYRVPRIPASSVQPPRGRAGHPKRKRVPTALREPSEPFAIGFRRNVAAAVVFWLPPQRAAPSRPAVAAQWQPAATLPGHSRPAGGHSGGTATGLHRVPFPQSLWLKIRADATTPPPVSQRPHAERAVLMSGRRPTTRSTSGLLSLHLHPRA